MVSFRTVLLLIANVGDSLVAHCGEVARESIVTCNVTNQIRDWESIRRIVETVSHSNNKEMMSMKVDRMTEAFSLNFFVAHRTENEWYGPSF